VLKGASLYLGTFWKFVGMQTSFVAIWADGSCFLSQNFGSSIILLIKDVNISDYQIKSR